MQIIYTADLREEAESITFANPELALILQEVRAAGTMGKVVKVEYAFGESILTNGRLTLSDWALSQDLSFGIVLAGGLETFIHVNGLVVPIAILNAGKTFAISNDESLSVMPLPLLNMSAGARSMFLLPKITDNMGFWRLAQAFGLANKEPPNDIQEHWQVFREIARKVGSPWRTRILFFGKEWLNCNSLANYKLHQYLTHTNLPNGHFLRKKLVFDMAFSEAINQLSFKPDPFLVDNIKHIFAIASQFVPGFVFAGDDTLGPIQLIQDAFIEHYGLNYTPSILLPGYAQKGRLCYHSLQHPTLLKYTPQQRRENNVQQLRELYLVLYQTLKHIKHLSPIHDELSDMISTELEFFHADGTKHREIEPSNKIKNIDPAIQKQIDQFHFPFCDTSTFLGKGCIAVSKPPAN